MKFKNETLYHRLTDHISIGIKSAGIEGFDFVPPASVSDTLGRFEIALLCLGMMHFHFGHPKQALEVSMSRGLPLSIKNPFFFILI